MSEDEARAWLAARWDGTKIQALEHLVALILAESALQNLIAPSTISQVWSRHVVDSAQLLAHAQGVPEAGIWLDIGTGAGFPGLVVACLCDRPVMLVEPRARRAAFLSRAIGALGAASRVTVAAAKVAAVRTGAAVISARAVGPLTALFADAEQVAGLETRWILPKGRSAREELATARQTWQGTFHVEHSVTDPDALIVVASKVARR